MDMRAEHRVDGMRCWSGIPGGLGCGVDIPWCHLGGFCLGN